jgi:hypothetical protein
MIGQQGSCAHGRALTRIAITTTSEHAPQFALPRLRNGANLSARVYNTGATTSGGTFFASLDYAWGG